MYGKDILNIRTKDEKWANRSTVLYKYSKYTQLITITNTGHWYWQMVKLLKQKQFLWIFYPDLPVCSEQLPWGKESEGKKKTKRKKKSQHPTDQNKQTSRKCKNAKPTKEGLKSSPLSVCKYCRG